jgi:hypothetical protein
MLRRFFSKKIPGRRCSQTRAALLPTPGDPFLVNLWFKSFETVWSDEVDRLYVHINSYLDKRVVDSLTRRLLRNPKVSVFYDDRMVDHGNSLTKLLKECREDLVMFIEDDAFIFKSGAVDSAFAWIEEGRFDCVGSPRGSCAMKLFDLGMKKFNNPTIGFDTGPHFWPNFFFCRHSDLMRTDLNFGGFQFPMGHKIPALDYTVDESPMYGDTFVWGSLQLRGLGLRCGYVEQYKIHPNDFDECRSRTNCFDGKAPWFHSGNLSGSLHSWLRGPDGRPIGAPGNAAPVDMDEMPAEAKGHGATDEFERRVTFLEMAHEASGEEFGEIEFFKQKYKEAIQLLIKRYRLSPKKINDRKKMYQKLLKPVLRKTAPWSLFYRG